MLESVISNTPISAKHNPFYKGAFNGNDCFRLIANHDLIFKTLTDYATEEIRVVGNSTEEESNTKARDEANKIIDICKRHHAIWAALNNLLPDFRSVRKLTRSEKDNLLEDIQKYWDAYIENCSGSVTTKIHLLKDHVKRLLETYGTIGLFAEDAMESIHAIINELARRYAPLDGARKVKQTVRALAGRKRTSVATEAMKAHECKPPKKGSRRQGVSSVRGVVTNEIADDKHDVAVANAVAFFQKIDTDDAEAQYTFLGPDAVVIYCQKCKAAGTDMAVPQDLLPLHDLVVHSDKGAEIS
jgi:hypothetical protein